MSEATNTILLDRAVRLIQTGQTAEGLTLLRRYLQLQPSDVKGLLWLASTTTDINEKISVASRVLTLQPDNKEARQILTSSLQNFTSVTSNHGNNTIDGNLKLPQGSPFFVQVVNSPTKEKQPTAQAAKVTLKPITRRSNIGDLFFWLTVAVLIGIALAALATLWLIPANKTFSTVQPQGDDDFPTALPTPTATPIVYPVFDTPVPIILPTATPVPPYQPSIVGNALAYGVTLDQTPIFRSYSEASSVLTVTSLATILQVDAHTGDGQWWRVSKKSGGGWVETEAVQVFSTQQDATKFANKLLHPPTATPFSETMPPTDTPPITAGDTTPAPDTTDSGGSTTAPSVQTTQPPSNPTEQSVATTPVFVAPTYPTVVLPTISTPAVFVAPTYPTVVLPTIATTPKP